MTAPTRGCGAPAPSGRGVCNWDHDAAGGQHARQKSPTSVDFEGCPDDAPPPPDDRGERHQPRHPGGRRRSAPPHRTRRAALTELKNAPKGKGGVSPSADQKPLSDQDIRLHALNLAVAGRKDAHRLVIKDDGMNDEFAGICIGDAVKYEAYIRGEA